MRLLAHIQVHGTRAVTGEAFYASLIRVLVNGDHGMVRSQYALEHAVGASGMAELGAIDIEDGRQDAKYSEMSDQNGLWECLVLQEL